ncbi:hypothetical protein ACFT9I_33830 [Streptomyces sp. NPDC057137]|uniref:hypothetical protein n=1 Tax=Streptomyces sp. NPDC057137 TaxID=3346030 RepID=UPI00364206DF
MRVARILATAALSSLVLGAGATTAQAGGQSTLTVSPSPATPGSAVTISLNGGCQASSVTASSAAFTGSVTLSSGSTEGVYRGTATIRSDARAGSNSITIACPNGAPSTFTFQVGTTTPSRGARGGLGGSVTDMDATKVATGAALVTLAAAGTTLVLRRRAKN